MERIPEDLLSMIFWYIVSLKDYKAVLETCKLFYIIGWKKLDFSVKNNLLGRLAAKHGCVSVVARLLGKKKDYFSINPSSIEIHAIVEASKNGHFDVVRLLLQDSRIDLTVRGHAALQFAAYDGHTKVVELLLKDGRVDPSTNNNNAIQYASMYGHIEVVRLLLKDKRVDPSVDNNFAIKMASFYGYVEIVEMLLKDKRVDPSADRQYALIGACREGYDSVVELLLKDSRVDPSVKNQSAIKEAAQKKYSRIVKLLLQHPKVFLSDEEVESIIKYRSHSRVAKLLLKRGEKKGQNT